MVLKFLTLFYLHINVKNLTRLLVSFIFQLQPHEACSIQNLSWLLLQAIEEDEELEQLKQIREGKSTLEVISLLFITLTTLLSALRVLSIANYYVSH